MTDRALITIGRERDSRGEPLITANGAVLGTVWEVTRMISEYEQSETMRVIEEAVVTGQLRRAL